MAFRLPAQWLLFALTTTLFMGVWGALVELPERAGFPATLGFCVWALTMVPCALVALLATGSRPSLRGKGVRYALLAGWLGAGGQLLLFLALRSGPAYLIFPVISLSPVLTVALAYFLLRENAGRRVWTGVAMSFPAIAMLSYQPGGGGAGLGSWLPLTAGVFVVWGVQILMLKVAHRHVSAVTIYFYMAIGAVSLIPFALWLTDFSAPIEWAWRGPWAATGIALLNSIGALALVYALRDGKAMVVTPMTALAPVITVVLSLALYRVIPHSVVAIGLVVATAAIFLMAED